MDSLGSAVARCGSAEPVRRFPAPPRNNLPPKAHVPLSVLTARRLEPTSTRGWVSETSSRTGRKLKRIPVRDHFEVRLWAWCDHMGTARTRVGGDRPFGRSGLGRSQIPRHPDINRPTPARVVFFTWCRPGTVVLCRLCVWVDWCARTGCINNRSLVSIETTVHLLLGTNPHAR